MAEQSLDYWREDIVPLLLALFLVYRLMRNLLLTMAAYEPPPKAPPTPVSKENIQRVHATVAQLPESTNLTPEQVAEEVARRIEAQKAAAVKRVLQPK